MEYRRQRQMCIRERGAGPGKIHLYRGQQCVQRNIPSHDAVDKLIELIRSEGRWIEPVEASAA